MWLIVHNSAAAYAKMVDYHEGDPYQWYCDNHECVWGEYDNEKDAHEALTEAKAFYKPYWRD